MNEFDRETDDTSAGTHPAADDWEAGGAHDAILADNDGEDDLQDDADFDADEETVDAGHEFATQQLDPSPEVAKAAGALTTSEVLKKGPLGLELSESEPIEIRDPEAEEVADTLERVRSGELSDRQKSQVAAKESEGTADFRATQRRIRQKLHYVRAYLVEGALPAQQADRQPIDNIRQTGTNLFEFGQPDSAGRQELRRYLAQPGEVDRFEVQERSRAFVDEILKNTQELDVPDLVVISRGMRSVFYNVVNELPQSTLSRNTDRIHDLDQAIRLDLVQAISARHLVGDGIVSLEDAYKTAYGLSELTDVERGSLFRLQAAVRDRLIISDMTLQGGLWTMEGDRGDSSFAHPPAPGELEALNRTAAETVERLHLLRAYGVTPFEVSAEQIDFPWDIAVLPPMDTHDGVPRHADGAIADFMLLAPDPARGDISLHFDEREGGITQVTLGQSDALMRFRLHDNGQISYGLQYNNIPSDNAQAAFTEISTGIAFQRMRALFIALAFDAVVPDEVTRGRDVRGSVASTLNERPEQPLPQRLREIVLRRQKALQRAGIDRDRRTPEGWAGPTRTVEGYFRRLPEGCRARPTAEQEAREYYQSRGMRFPGLREGHTWVGEYDRRTDVEVTHRRARFRRDSATAQVTRDMRRRGGWRQ